jgi:hypothetical protein
MWIAAAHRSVCALTVATALTVGVVSVPMAVTPSAEVINVVHVYDVTLAAAISDIVQSSSVTASSTPTASDVWDTINPLQIQIDTLLRTAFVIFASPVVVPLVLLDVVLVVTRHPSPLLEAVIDFAFQFWTKPAPPSGAAASAVGPSAPAASVAATQQADPNDVALASVSSPSSLSNEVTRVVDQPFVQIVEKPFVQIAYWLGRWVELGAFIALAPVALPTLEFFHSLAPNLMSSYLDSVQWFLDRALVNPFTINPWPEATGASVALNREMSSAATDSTAASAPKPSVGGSRRAHRSAPEQGSAAKHEAAQPNTASGRTAAKHADAQKAGTRPTTAERRSGQGHGARGAH